MQKTTLHNLLTTVKLQNFLKKISQLSIRITILIRTIQKTHMIINRIYIFVIRKKFSCKKRGTQPHKSAQENPFKKFIELKSNKSNRLEDSLNFHSHLQHLKQRPKNSPYISKHNVFRAF